MSNVRPPSLEEFARDRHLPIDVLRVFQLRPVVHKGRPAFEYPTSVEVVRFKYTDGRQPKYWWKGGRRHWYGLPSARQRLAPGGVLYLVNGEASVWACYAAGVSAISTCAGENTMPTPEMIAELKAIVSSMKLTLRIVYDTDDAGHQGGLRLAARLRVEIPDVQALDLGPQLPDVPDGDVDDLHQRVGDRLGAVLAALPPLPGQENSPPSSIGSRVSRDNRDDRDVRDGRDAPAVPDPLDPPAAPDRPGLLGAPEAPGGPGTPGTPGGPERLGAPAPLDVPDPPDADGQQAQLQGRLIEAARATADQVRSQSPRQLRKASFRLAQALRGVEGADAAFDADPDVVLSAIHEFCHGMADLPREQGRLDLSDPEAVFFAVAAAWRKVRVAGTDALGAAFRHAQRNPVILRGRAGGKPPRFTRLVSTAFHLQRFRRDQSILLPTPRLALPSMLACHPSTVSAVIDFACQLGLLVMIDDRWSYTGHRAKEFRFNFESPLYIPSTDAVVVGNGAATDGPCQYGSEPTRQRDDNGDPSCPRGEGCKVDAEGVEQDAACPPSDGAPAACLGGGGTPAPPAADSDAAGPGPNATPGAISKAANDEPPSGRMEGAANARRAPASVLPAFGPRERFKL